VRKSYARLLEFRPPGLKGREMGGKGEKGERGKGREGRWKGKEKKEKREKWVRS